MKIALVCPSNILYMPYIQYYIKILNKLEIDYDIINWDRFNCEKSSEYVYRDNKTGHRRNFIDYYKFSKFLDKNLVKNNYDKVIIFGIQLAFFMKKKLLSLYPNNYILDIRDYNKLMNFFSMRNVIEQSKFTVISSPGFFEWLPKNNKYIVNHNTDISEINDLKRINNLLFQKEKYIFSYIGSLRDYEINIRLINSLKNCKFLCINYHGEGQINNALKKYITLNKIENVDITGRYSKIDEEALYENSDLINILIPNKDLNSTSLLPNRLYNAIKYGKPIVTFTGTHTSFLVEKFNLGIVIKSFDSLEREILDYITNFNSKKFDESRSNFIKHVLSDNNEFKSKFIDFILK